jgi:hypothetical protein
MPSFNQQALVNKIRSGNAVAILVGDQVIGFGQTTTNGIDFGTEQFYGIGSKKPQENQQLKYSPTITLDNLQLTAAGVSFFGYSTTWLKVLVNTQLNFTIADAAGNPILTFLACTAQNFTSTIPVNQPITEATSFVAMDVLDENGLSILDDGTDAVAVNILASAAPPVVAG